MESQEHLPRDARLTILFVPTLAMHVSSPFPKFVFSTHLGEGCQAPCKGWDGGRSSVFRRPSVFHPPPLV